MKESLSQVMAVKESTKLLSKNSQMAQRDGQDRKNLILRKLIDKKIMILSYNSNRKKPSISSICARCQK